MIKVVDIKIKNINLLLARKISEEKANRLRVVIYNENDDCIFVLMEEYKKSVIDEIYFIFRKKVVELIVSKEKMDYFLKVIYLGNQDDAEKIILSKAINLNASDIHFEPYKDFVIVRFRIDGFLRVVYLLKIEEYLTIVSKIKINGNLNMTERRKPQDGKITFEYRNKSYDLRVSIIPIVYGEKVVIRILYGDIFNYSLEKLNLTSSQIKKLKYIMKVNTGLVIVNGPTGSGKSTTLYTILQELNKEDINITTLEDPIEAIIPGICQMNLNRALDINFSTGLRSILRQDPDVILVGEIRDEETADIAIKASLTGHKVYSTIHTKDPREVYLRLQDMGIEHYLIKDSLVGIISQRLLRLLCDNCKRKVKKINFDGREIWTYEKEGCNECNYTGYRGRGLVASINIINDNIKKSLKNIYQDNNILSNIEMVENLNALLNKGKISYDDYKTFIEMEGINYKSTGKIIEEN